MNVSLTSVPSNRLSLAITNNPLLGSISKVLSSDESLEKEPKVLILPTESILAFTNDGDSISCISLGSVSELIPPWKP